MRSINIEKLSASEQYMNNSKHNVASTTEPPRLSWFGGRAQDWRPGGTGFESCWDTSPREVKYLILGVTV